MVLKSYMSLSDELNEPLTIFYALTKEDVLERLANTNSKKIILFPSDYNDNRFENNVNVRFHILEKKFKYVCYVTMCYLKNKYGF